MEDKLRQFFEVTRRGRAPFRLATAVLFLLAMLLMIILCHCNKTVDITFPPGEGGVSAQGTCVACHTNEEMVELTAKPIPSPEEGEGEG